MATVATDISGLLRHRIAQKMLQTIAHKCDESTIERADKWTERFRVMGNPFPGPWSFRHHPWTRGMILADEQECIGQKAAQMGYTEVCLNRTLFTVVQKREDALYVLPAKTPDAADFSAARFDPALEMSPRLSAAFTSVKNVGLKRAGGNSLYVRGSRSRSQLKSIPVSFLAFDEVEEMEEESISLGRERSSGQIKFQLWMISTPSVPGVGINAAYERSSQDHFFFKCPCCGRHTELIYPDCLVITGDAETDPDIKKSYLQCKECQGVLHHEDKPNFLAEAEWVSQFDQRDVRGFHINQMYSSAHAGRPSELAKAAMRATTNVSDEQEWYNSKLGLPHIVAGAQLTESDVKQCFTSRSMADPIPRDSVITIGIDVGKVCYYEVVQWLFNCRFDSVDINNEAFARVLRAGTFGQYTEAEALMYKYHPVMTVVDNLPDTRATIAFAKRFPGLVKRCSYTTGSSAREIVDHGEQVTVDRTTWIDLALSRFTNKRIDVPHDVPRDYTAHMSGLVRHYTEHRTTGEKMAIYKKVGPDHFAHARNYAEVALRVASLTRNPQSGTSRVL